MEVQENFNCRLDQIYTKSFLKATFFFFPLKLCPFFPYLFSLFFLSDSSVRNKVLQNLFCSISGHTKKDLISGLLIYVGRLKFVEHFAM